MGLPTWLEEALANSAKEGLEAAPVGAKDIATKGDLEAADDLLRGDKDLTGNVDPESQRLINQQGVSSTLDKLPPRSPADQSAEVFERNPEVFEHQQTPVLPEGTKRRADLLAAFKNLKEPVRNAQSSAKVFEDAGKVPNFEMVGAPKSQIPKDAIPIPGEEKPLQLPSVQSKYGLPENINTSNQIGKSDYPTQYGNTQELNVSSEPDSLPDTGPQATKEELTPFGSHLDDMAPPEKNFGEQISDIGQMIKDNKNPLLATAGAAAAGVAGASMLPIGGDTTPPQGMADVAKANDSVPAPKPASTSVNPVDSDSSDESDDSDDESSNKESANSQPSNAQALTDLTAKQGSGSSYNDAINAKNLAVLGNQLGAAGDIIGGAIARTGPNQAAQKAFQQNVAQAQSIPQDFKDSKMMEELDPNSDVSKYYRQFLTRYGVKVPDNITANQIKSTLLPAAEKEQLKNMQQKYLQSKMDISRQDRLDFKDRQEGAQIEKEMNGLSASSRSVIGASAMAKRRAQSLLSLVNDPNATPQDMVLASNELNTIVTNTSTIAGAKHQEYNSLANDLVKTANYILNNATAADVPKQKAHMADVANRMVSLSDQIQEQQFNRVKAGHFDFFKRRPEVVNGIIDSMRDSAESALPQNKGTAPQGQAPSVPNVQLAPNEIMRKSSDGRYIIYDKNTKKPLREAQ